MNARLCFLLNSFKVVCSVKNSFLNILVSNLQGHINNLCSLNDNPVVLASSSEIIINCLTKIFITENRTMEFSLRQVAKPLNYILWLNFESLLNKHSAIFCNHYSKHGGASNCTPASKSFKQAANDFIVFLINLNPHIHFIAARCRTHTPITIMSKFF